MSLFIWALNFWPFGAGDFTRELFAAESQNQPVLLSYLTCSTGKTENHKVIVDQVLDVAQLPQLSSTSIMPSSRQKQESVGFQRGHEDIPRWIEAFFGDPKTSEKTCKDSSCKVSVRVLIPFRSHEYLNAAGVDEGSRLLRVRKRKA
ncbi:hypothetical protein CPC08DRAFT_726233 [Agrocybe pediades]|nr:hypothetical protein CPC08DRAFT_726233 [Agrocybe pediades]